MQGEDSPIKTIGFYGAYAYDIVLYLARSLAIAGKQILVIDRSAQQEIVRTIRSENEGELSCGIFRFCGIDITSLVLMPTERSLETNYDFVIYDFGTNDCNEEYHACDVICYVLDMYAHNALHVQEAQEPKKAKETWMVLRDLFRGKAMARYHMRISGKNVDKENLFSIRLSIDDFIARFRMETDQLPRVELASDEMQEVIKQMSKKVFPSAFEKKKGKGFLFKKTSA